MLLALEFVSINDVGDAFDEHSGECSQVWTLMLDWLEDSYIGWPHRRGLFPLEMGNVYDRVIQNMNRTNNRVEATHRRVKVELQRVHPTIWKSMAGIRWMQKDVMLLISIDSRKSPAPEMHVIQCAIRGFW